MKFYRDNLSFDPAGRHHLVLTEGIALEHDISMPSNPIEVWGAPRNGSCLIADRIFVNFVEIFDALEDRLAQETIGLRLYCLGEAEFLQSARAVALRYGLGPMEVALISCGRSRFRCVHCQSGGFGAPGHLVVCDGCGHRLQVRDHFAERHGAFIGVAHFTLVSAAAAPGKGPKI